jgi:plasmid stabilization system protein ParE
MILPVRLWDEAKTEFDDAMDWYEQQRAGLGARFATAIHDQLDRIARQPNMHGKIRNDVRKSVVRGFPYCIFYLAEPSEVVVLSIFHTSRDPAVWQSRADLI